MSNQRAKIYLLPGFDGTGDLFAGLVQCLPRDLEIHIVRYPKDEYRSYDELVKYLETIIPESEPFLVLAESFSAPVAIQIAAQNRPNLKGLILCAGFARTPILGLRRSIVLCIGPALLGFTPPSLMIRLLLVGTSAPRSLVTGVRAAVSSVKRNVLVGRLNSVLGCDVRGEVAKIRVPVLYLHAHRDRIVPGSRSQEIAKLNPLCTVAEINGPHLLLQRNPTESANAIKEFIRGLENNESR